ncbi:hypothetical protein AB1N83_011025 [Pleurotus pulmonarius]
MESHFIQELGDKETRTPELTTFSNTQAPISKLPPELLGEIFVLAKSHKGDSYYPNVSDVALGQRWSNVAGVCRNWREIALGAPRMWDTLDLPNIRCLEWATLLVTRANNAPLRVRCVDQPLSVDRAVLSFVFSRIDTIKDIELGLSLSGRPKIEEFFGTQKTAYILQSLRIYRRDTVNDDIPMNGAIHGLLNAIQMPSLRTLEVTSFSLPQSISPLPQLRRLYYSPPLSGVEEATTSGLLSFLRSAPSLEELEIRHPLQPSGGGSTTVTLPNLSFLSYTTTRVEDSALFRFIHYPSSSRIKFMSSHPPASGTALCSSDLATVLTHLSHSDRITKCTVASFVAHGSYFGILVEDCHGLVFDLSFTTREGDILSLLKLSAMLPPSGARTLHICGFHSVSIADWGTLLSRHEQVQDLGVERVDVNFMRALLRPSQTELPPFMQLKRFIINRCDIEESAASIERILVERRELQSPIDVVRISGCRVTVDTINHLEEYADVLWDCVEVLNPGWIG